MVEKTVKIMWEGEEKDVVLKDLVWGDYKYARSESIVAREYKGEPMQFREVDKYEDCLLMKAIKSSPFPATMQGVESLPKDVRNQLINEIIPRED